MAVFSKEPCSDSPNPDLPKTYLIRIGRVVSWIVNLNPPTLTPELDPKIPKTTLVAGHSLASTQGFVGLAVASSQLCRYFWGIRSFDASGKLQGTCACSGTEHLAANRPESRNEVFIWR